MLEYLCVKYGKMLRKLSFTICILLVAYPVAPGSPVAVETQHTSVLLEWSYDGDKNQISQFRVERRQFGDDQWTLVTTVGALDTTQVIATGLYPFTSYQFRVLSVNDDGVSSAGNPSVQVVTKEAAPTAKPFNVMPVDSNYTAVVLEWEVSRFVKHMCDGVYLYNAHMYHSSINFYGVQILWVLYTL